MGTTLRIHTLGGLTIERDAVGLHPDGDVWLDASAFEEQLDTAGSDAEGLSSALDLYQGNFLAGF